MTNFLKLTDAQNDGKNIIININAIQSIYTVDNDETKWTIVYAIIPLAVTESVEEIEAMIDEAL